MNGVLYDLVLVIPLNFQNVIRLVNCKDHITFMTLVINRKQTKANSVKH